MPASVSILILHIRPCSVSSWLCVFCFLPTAKEAAAAAARGINSLSLKWCRVFIRGIFTCLWTGAIYIWLFLKEDLWRISDITVRYDHLGNGWEDTSGEGLCMFWHGIMALLILHGSTAAIEITSVFTYTWIKPPLTFELVHDISYGYTYHCTIPTLLTELCHYVFLGDLTLYITDSWKYFRLIWWNQ